MQLPRGNDYRPGVATRTGVLVVKDALLCSRRRIAAPVPVEGALSGGVLPS